MNLDLVGIFGVRFTTILALIAAELIMGIALALHKGEFEWRKVLRFYKTNVGPYLLGYLAFAILVKFADLELLGDYQIIAEEGSLWVVWLFIVKAIGWDSFYQNAKELFNGFQQS